MSAPLPAPRLQGWRPWGRAVLDLVWPAHCPACDTPLGAEPAGDFCPACQDTAVRLEPPTCAVCAEPFSGVITDPAFTCPNCHGRPQSFDFATAAWMGRGAVRETIHRFKYGSRISLRLPLARLMQHALTDPRIAARPDWVLVPVPLHPRRFRERQFNQAAELARTLSALSGLPVVDLLRRSRYTTTQAALRREDRLRNLKGAFGLRWFARRRLADRPVLLVDDVLTTGSTANACARVLKRQAGARIVAVLTVARA